jgi:hypothetical protein
MAGNLNSSGFREISMHELQIKMLRADRPAGTEPPEQEHDAGFTDTGRLVALCDGVFAIIITLLVLEIHRPSAEPGSLAQELLKELSRTVWRFSMSALSGSTITICLNGSRRLISP